MTQDAPLDITHAIGERLTRLGQTLATAESCSGGLIAHRITNVPGSSVYFLGGVVVYSNAAKMDLLNVPETDLAKHGAVSEVVAQRMAEGVRIRFQATYGVGVTGIAGPSGGSPDKPVGLVYIAVAGAAGTFVTRNVFPGTRQDVKEQTAENALNMVLERIA
ncbi:MAG: CinA family protein [Candidatus Hydrogenedentes bacterium]|nr:CinA family protein [Candidatus Hydrogenedentota bacterium]